MKTVYAGIVIATSYEVIVPGCKERFLAVRSRELNRLEEGAVLRQCGIVDPNYGPGNEFKHVGIYMQCDRVFVIEIDDRAPPAGGWELRTARIHEWPGNAKAGVLSRARRWLAALCAELR